MRLSGLVAAALAARFIPLGAALRGITEEELHPRYLVQCEVTDEHQRALLWDQVVNSNLDLWDGIPRTARNATMLATKDQLSRLRAFLSCSGAIDVGVLEQHNSKLGRGSDAFMTLTPWSHLDKIQ